MELIYSAQVQAYRQFFVPVKDNLRNCATLTWGGANTLFLKNGNSSLLIDPYFSRLAGVLSLPFFYRRFRSDTNSIGRGLQLLGITKADAILLTHTHIDHALDVETILRTTRTPLLYTPPLLYHKLHGKSVPFTCRLLSDDLAFTAGSFAIRVTKGSHMPFPLPTAEAEHWLNRHQGRWGKLRFAWQWTADAAYCFQITTAGRKLFVMGSAGLPDTSLQGKTADILILSVGGLDLLSRSYCEHLLEETVDILHPEAVWLSHWDDFTRPLSEPVGWLKHAHRVVDYIIARNRARGVPTYLLPPGKAVKVVA